MHSHDSAFTSAGTLAVYYCRYRESRGGSPIRKTSVLSCVHHLFFHTSFSYFLRPRIIGQPRIFHPLLFVFDSFRDIFTRSKVFACCEPVCSFFLSFFYFIFCFNFFIFFFTFFFPNLIHPLEKGSVFHDYVHTIVSLTTIAIL